MAKLLHTIEKSVQVGIYDNCTQSARVYEDRTIATLPYVKWVGNTGGYAEEKRRLTGAQHAAILSLLEDGAEDDAWDVIATGEIPKRVGRPNEMTGGKRVNVYLDDESLAIAAELGDGNVSEGIRKALQQAG